MNTIIDTRCLPETGFVRLQQLIGADGPIPVSKSTIWAWIAAGTFPAPVKLGSKISAFRVEEVRAFISQAGGRS